LGASNQFLLNLSVFAWWHSFDVSALHIVFI